MPMHYEVLDSEVVDLTAVKKLLKEKPKKEMTYEQKMAFEHASSFSKLTEKKAADLSAELKDYGLIKLTDDLIAKIIDLMPGTLDELKLVLANSKITFKKKEFEDILGIVKKYV